MPRAMRALKANSFAAAVNSTAAVASGEGVSFRLRDWVDVAVLQYGGFPLFVRRYPGSIGDCALDLFFGKPLLLVEHHGYFRHGYDRLADAINEINALDGDVQWSGLGEAVARSALWRIGAAGTIDVKAYSHRIHVTNTSGEQRKFRISKGDSRDAHVTKVTCHGEPRPFEVDERGVSVSLMLARDASEELELWFGKAWDDRPLPSELNQRLAVWVRRRLSEFRDNYLSRHEGALALAYRIKERVVRD